MLVSTVFTLLYLLNYCSHHSQLVLRESLRPIIRIYFAFVNWVPNGFLPGFAKLIFKHLGDDRADNLLKALALMKVFSLEKLISIATSGNVQVFKRKFV